MSALGVWWRGAGAGAWIGSALALMAVTLFVLYRPASDKWIEHGLQNLGPLAIRVASHGPVEPGAKITLRIESDAPVDTPPTVLVGINSASMELQLAGQQEIELAVPSGNEALELHLVSPAGVLRWYLGRPI